MKIVSITVVDSNSNKDRFSSLLIEETKQQQQRQLPEQYNKKEIVDTEDEFSNTVGMKVISTIPCYCDIQFSKREFLTAIHILHPFSERVASLANLMQQELQDNEIE